MACNLPSDRTVLSDQYQGFAQDILFRELPKAMRRFPRIVLWGGREGDVQFGSPEYHEWVEAHRPRTPRFVWHEDEICSDHLHLGTRRA